MATVFYLCRPPEDSNTFVFANELPDNYYSPGLFVVESDNSRGELGPAFKFLARQYQQTLYLELKRAERWRTYIVDAGQYGIFYFKAIALDRNIRYSGKNTSLFHNKPLYRLEPANMTLLERACVERNFYFVGGAGEDSEI